MRGKQDRNLKIQEAGIMITKSGIFPILKLNAGIKKYVCFCLIVCFLWACNPTERVDNPVETNHPKPERWTSLPEENSFATPVVTSTSEISSSSKLHQDKTEHPKITIMPEIIDPEDLPHSNPITGEVPEEILENIIDDLSQRNTVNKLAIRVIKAEAVTWSDGALGCPKLGEFYTQALVHGYWVILQIEKKNYDYRVSNSGHFFLCEGKGNYPITPPEISPPQK
jgi:hypothetical protein